MERLLKDFNLPPDAPEDARIRWRKAVGLLIRNRRRRFRYVANLKQRSEAAKTLQDLRVAFMVHKAAIRFSDAGRNEYTLSKETQEEGFGIDSDELASIVRGHDTKGFNTHGGVEGLAMKVSSSLKDGISSSDIPCRQKIYGQNKYTEKPPRGFWTFVWEALHDLTLIILMVCAVVSVGVGISTEGLPKGMYDGVGILLSIFLVVIVTAVSDYKQSLQFIDLDKEKKKIFVQVTRDGRRQKVLIFDLVVGDIVNLSNGDIVPADGIFISGYNLLIDESSLTGESEPINITNEKPFLLCGTKVQDGSATMLVTAVGMKTEWGKLMETLSEGGQDETPLQVKLNGVATIIGKIGLLFAVLTFLVLTIRFVIEKVVHDEISHWSSEDALKLLDYFAIAVTIIVVAVPEGLPLAVTLSLAFAMKKLMNDKALVRHLTACETMGSATSICTDKTGTLTTNHMVVEKIWLAGKERELKGKDLKSDVSESTLTTLLQVIFLNTGAEIVKDHDGKTSIQGQATDSALLGFGMLLGGNFEEFRQKYQIKNVEPFNSVRKKMSVLVALPEGGTRAFCKGASEIVLGLCHKMIDCNGNSVDISEEHFKNITNVINGFADQALRTLCLAFRDMDVGYDENSIPEDGYTLVAVVGIKDPVRPGVTEAVQTCLAAGITVRMVTGDNINTAKAIARECGILTEGGLAVEGSEFRSKTHEEMKEISQRIQVMARSLPLDKHKLVSNLRILREVVSVTGDGTNDAPALHESDIGLAMGIAGTEVAKESADVIILDDNFSTIVNVVKWGRAVYINIQKFVQFQLTVNIVALMLNFVAACITGSAPLTAVQLLWVNMIMDTLGALALATEPPTDELMKRPPIGRNVSFITKTMWRNILGQSVYQFAVLAVLSFDGERLLRLGGPDSQVILNTVIFNSFVFCQVFNEINSRDIEKINVFRGIFSSWIFMVVMVSTVAFQAIIVEFLGTFASTVPLNWQLWLISILIGAVSMPLAVILKCIPVERNAAPQHHNGYEALPSGPEQV
ncbi:putative calcium-transporting ATPase 11, plasma membrane-type isoform X2 [Chenopodium quinoa]|uniref:putative calcium-transporting ATPase 11, plasma membrane-type isoform X1 n=1 Tax=Chenopodium quinoa TaxID=63459 RepID=UPI000B78F923|nr:putative calcium-transporting ATPase 11, plasma membrane-type isoform X1 [Chenopodium quinoa]XP_021724181.1 putative calcium-transporting ATPase 11, plasma membrane-type isoform X2 [Chenopodium quinoa]